MHLYGDIINEIVQRQRRVRAHDRRWHAKSHREQVDATFRSSRLPEDSPAEFVDHPFITHPIKIA